MSPLTDQALHYLIVDVRDDRPILVFLGTDPALQGGPRGEPVHLELLSPMERFGRPGRPTVGRPVLGKARSSNCYREFCSTEDMWEAGFLPVACYRVCDDWLDYHDPWSSCKHDAIQTAIFQETNGS
jgi:hypothetical protein